MAVRITCIKKDNGYHFDPHEAITLFGWLNEATDVYDSSTLPQMIAFVEAGNKAYVKDRYGHIAYLEVMRSYAGNKYLRTVPDGRMSDNLLTLAECIGV